MTDKELRKLSRIDLLDLLIIERQEIDKLLEERDRLLADLSSLNVKLVLIGKELTDAQALLQSRFPAAAKTEEAQEEDSTEEPTQE